MATMTIEVISATLKQLVVEELGVPYADITDDSNFVEDLGADSLEVVELIGRIEDAFNLVLTDDEAEKLQTFGDVVQKLDELLNKK